MTTATRKYTPIWKALKANGIAVIAAPKAFHRRIVRAVIKEKYMDLEYHFLMSQDCKRPKISYASDAAKITFRLIENALLETL